MTATLDDIVEQDLGVVLLLLELDLKPVAHAWVAIGMTICCHG